MQHLITYGKKEITFTIEYVERKTLQINVCPDLSVEVKAPINAEFEKIIAKVKKRAKWICQQQRYFSQFLPLQPERRFISGETHRYLGRQCRLKVLKSSDCAVKMSGGYLNVYLPVPNDSSEVQKMVTKWYRSRAEIVYKSILDNLQSVLITLKIEQPEFKIRLMKTRWGSCSKSGRITLNSELIKAPKSCIKYVIIHELCHLRHYHHNKQFYNLLEQFCPDWKREKEKLNQMADLIL